MNRRFLVICTSEEDGTVQGWYPTYEKAAGMARDMAEGGFTCYLARNPEVFDALPPKNLNAGIFAPATMYKPVPGLVSVSTSTG